ncbi:MAG: hypothetical protein TREMPRED_005336 [Tremellales sp. Tagirdzhanova-0007]|nr:MAG: hypothetical protein TREMPRED_005336 [Tremellales sp. Tagirdzhanova-0007]
MTGEDTAQDLSSQENTVKPQYSDPALIPTSSSRADDQKVTSDDSAGGTISKQFDDKTKFSFNDKTKFSEEPLPSLFERASDEFSRLRSWLPSRTTSAMIAVGGALMLGNCLWTKQASEMSNLKFETAFLRNATEYAESVVESVTLEKNKAFRHWIDEMSLLLQDLGQSAGMEGKKDKKGGAMELALRAFTRRWGWEKDTG